MALYASLGDLRLVSARLLMPAFGLWSADVQLSEDDALPAGPLTLSIGTLSLVGSVYRTGPWAGSRGVRIVGGFGGWRLPLKARLYSDTNGVKLSAVLRDAAAEVGEHVVVTGDRSVGPLFARAVAPASRLLSVLVGRAGWWLDALGITRLGDRPATPITSEFTPTAYRPELGAVTIATEDLAAWLPGVTFDHPLLPEAMQASSVSVNLEAGGRMRLEVLTA